MKEMYESGLSATKIAKILGISVYKVLKFLKESEIDVINKQNVLTLDVDKVITLYKSGLSLTQISKQLNVSVVSLSKQLRKVGVKIVNKQNITKFDNTIFDCIDSEEKAYWLGFIYADGYVSSRDNGFEISLGLKDLVHLNKFAKFLKHDNNVKVDSFRCRFSVVNKHLKQRLNELGITPKKSLIIQFPNSNQVPDYLIPHFIRGYFDGDGCILTKKTSVKKLSISLLGTRNILENVIKHSAMVTNILQDKRHSSEVFYISLGIKKAKIFADYIYKDSNIYLERKRENYEYYCRSVEKSSELLSSKNGES